MKTHRISIEGFTLLELLVVISIIAILSTLIMKGTRASIRQANQAKEVSAARQVTAAYLAYAGENDGELMPGYGPFPAYNEKGDALHNPVSARYPWRLAPYLHYEMRLLWGNNNDDALRKLALGPRSDYEYGVSVQPAFGINATFIGGDYQEFPPNKTRALELYGNFCVTRLAQTSHASQLIVFASAASGYQGSKLTGYFKVLAPNTTGRNWGNQWTDKSAPNDFGFVDFRYGEKAVVAMLDGHVEMMNFQQMDDMRRWSHQAAELDQKDWKLKGQ